MNLDWSATLADYRGLLTFPSVVDSQKGITYPSVTIPLFIKDHPIAVRTPKVTEIATGQMNDPGDMATGTHLIFFGAPDPLKLELNGWVITPTTLIGNKNVWDPTVDGSPNGSKIHASTQYSNYADLICAYIEGRMQVHGSGRGIRTDPSSYTDPYGRVYSNPIIYNFEASNVRPSKKQSFSITLYFERTPNG